MTAPRFKVGDRVFFKYDYERYGRIDRVDARSTLYIAMGRGAGRVVYMYSISDGDGGNFYIDEDRLEPA